MILLHKKKFMPKYNILYFILKFSWTHTAKVLPTCRIILRNDNIESFALIESHIIIIVIHTFDSTGVICESLEFKLLGGNFV